MEDQINELKSELQRLQEIDNLEKKTNAQLEVQIAELREKLNCKRVEEELETNFIIAELNKKIEELQKQFDKEEKSYQEKLIREQGEFEPWGQDLKSAISKLHVNF